MTRRAVVLPDKGGLVGVIREVSPYWAAFEREAAKREPVLHATYKDGELQHMEVIRDE